ncbi:hypothetical protein [Nocardioides panaciterrulae]|uniref:Uncharacterized protein n=2 Tax=Nocardioides panaciterrulae TaxID=661492 RepID=A0A7Y9EA69_9ACTN|nr:hypothetical protein [Nocardioides panaciterrulae]NYD44010.1 hypothetical protein [Nocardioides panaciterrulae]
MKTMVEQPKLRPHIVSATNPGGNGVIKFRNGSRILFGARERGFGRGFQKVAVIVFDEGQILTQSALDDMIPATNTHPNPLVFFIGTPPKPTDPSDVFLNMRHEALSGESGDYLYVEFSADEDADPADREQWAKANPSFPHRTPARAMLRMKRLLGMESFLREGLGIWDRVGGLGIFTAGAWSRCFIGYGEDGETPLEPVGEPLALGIAADLDQTWLSLGAAVGNDGKHHLGSVLRCRADVDAERFVAEVKRIQVERGVPVGIDKKGPASFLIPALEDAGVQLTYLGLDDFVQSCSDLRTAVEQGTVTPRRLRRPQHGGRRRRLAQGRRAAGVRPEVRRHLLPRGSRHRPLDRRQRTRLRRARLDSVKEAAMLTTALDLLGVACLAGFAWFVWPPAALLVVGAVALLVSWRSTR